MKERNSRENGWKDESKDTKQRDKGLENKGGMKRSKTKIKQKKL